MYIPKLELLREVNAAIVERFSILPSRKVRRKTLQRVKRPHRPFRYVLKNAPKSFSNEFDAETRMSYNIPCY